MGKRFDFRHDHISRIPAPLKVLGDSPEIFLVKMRSAEFGAVHVFAPTASSFERIPAGHGPVGIPTGGVDDRRHRAADTAPASGRSSL